MRYKYENNIVSFELFGYNIEVANVGGRQWRLAIVDCPGAVKNKFTKAGEYEGADYGDIAGTQCFWHFDHVPTIGEVDKIIREYKANKQQHDEFMTLIGARC